MYNFVCRLILSQKIYCPCFSRNNSISGANSLKALRKESLIAKIAQIYKKSRNVTISLSLTFCPFCLFLQRKWFQKLFSALIHFVFEMIEMRKYTFHKSYKTANFFLNRKCMGTLGAGVIGVRLYVVLEVYGHPSEVIVG